MTSNEHPDQAAKLFKQLTALYSELDKAYEQHDKIKNQIMYFKLIKVPGVFKSEDAYSFHLDLVKRQKENISALQIEADEADAVLAKLKKDIFDLLPFNDTWFYLPAISVFIAKHCDSWPGSCMQLKSLSGRKWTSDKLPHPSKC